MCSLLIAHMYLGTWERQCFQCLVIVTSQLKSKQLAVMPLPEPDQHCTLHTAVLPHSRQSRLSAYRPLSLVAVQKHRRQARCHRNVRHAQPQPSFEHLSTDRCRQHRCFESKCRPIPGWTRSSTSTGASDQLLQVDPQSKCKRCSITHDAETMCQQQLLPCLDDHLGCMRSSVESDSWRCWTRPGTQAANSNHLHDGRRCWTCLQAVIRRRRRGCAVPVSSLV
jgi:hypothetical protein